MLQSIKDNPGQLEKLYQFMLDELYTEEEDESKAIVIPGRYASCKFREC